MRLTTIALLPIGMIAGCTTHPSQGRVENRTEPSTLNTAAPTKECDATEGYVWSEVSNDCIRLFEKAILAPSTDNEQGGMAYIVFDRDSSRAELFFSDGQPHTVLPRRTISDSLSIWENEKEVSLTDGRWSIKEKGEIRYQQSKEEADSSLGTLSVRTYSGILPAASGPGIRYILTVRNRAHSGNGLFRLTMTYLEAENGADQSFEYLGQRSTLRGISGDNDATVWQLTAENGEQFNFLYEKEKETLTLLNNNFEKADSMLNYTLTAEEDTKKLSKE